MTQIIGTSISQLPLIAQTSGIPGLDGLLASLGDNLGGSLVSILGAIAILVLGWIIASIVSGIIYKVLNKTDIDNKIAEWVTGGSSTGEKPPIEKWISNTVFWIIILFTTVAVLDSLKLNAVSEPLNQLLGQISEFVPKLGGAALLAGVAWLLATIAKLVITKALGTLRLDERLNQQVSDTNNQFGLSETLGNAVYWFIFLVFLPSILSILGLEGTLEPVQTLLNNILAFLPNIFAGLLIGAAGWLIAQIVRRVVTNLLAATGVDRVGEKFGLTASAGRQSLSWIIGTVVYVLILIPIAISVLNTLKIEAISAPATAMLEQVLEILPRIFSATVILAIAYAAGQYISELVTNILSGVGFNNVFVWLGLSKKNLPSDPQAEAVELTKEGKIRTPSQLVGIIVLVGIMLIATLTAVEILQIEALTTVVESILEIAAQVLVGLVVFAVGLYFANLAYNLIAASGNRQAKILGQTARISIITLVSAMALQQMGIATNIVNLAFGLLVGGIAVAIALAFGLGGRDVAGEQLREWIDSFKQQ